MANGATKAELQDSIDGASDVLADVYTPEATREDLAKAVGEALDILEGDGNGDDDSDSDGPDPDDPDSLDEEEDIEEE